MNTMTDTPSLAITGRHKMTPSEAFVETLVAHGVKDVFGIVGSAYMDALDLFPLAGIRFISVAHEQGGGHMADGYSRVSGRQGVCIAQNGPGITNFVTSVAAAYWAHSPVVCITPETGSGTLGLGGFSTLLVHKYYLDDLYFNGIVRPIRDTWSAGVYWFNQNVLDGIVNGAAVVAYGLSSVTMWIDRNIIDGAVNGTGTAMETFGKGLRTLQSGKVQWYAVGLFAGVILLTAFFVR